MLLKIGCQWSNKYWKFSVKGATTFSSSITFFYLSNLKVDCNLIANKNDSCVVTDLLWFNASICQGPKCGKHLEQCMYSLSQTLAVTSSLKN